MIRTLWVVLAALVWTPWYGFRILYHARFETRRGKEFCPVLARRWADRLVRAAGVEVVFENADRLLRPGGQILVANHVSWYDVLTLAAYLPVEYCFIAKKELERVPIFGPSWKACGHISIDRDDRAKAIASLEEAGRRVRASDATIVIFPEGTRSPTPEMLPFKKGAFALAAQVGVPIIPVGIVGSREVMPKHSFRIRPGTIRIRVGEPIEAEEIASLRRDEITRLARERVTRLLES